MRLWSIDFSYLDAKGLVALWRESLLAKHVILGLTKGYKNHPQLDRFYAHETPQMTISAYLDEIWREATVRGYKFDRTKVGLDSVLSGDFGESLNLSKDTFGKESLLSFNESEFDGRHKVKTPSKNKEMYLGKISKIDVTNTQVEYEFDFLQTKLKVRDMAKFQQNLAIRKPKAMSLFRVVLGEIEPWERVKF